MDKTAVVLAMVGLLLGALAGYGIILDQLRSYEEELSRFELTYEEYEEEIQKMRE